MGKFKTAISALLGAAYGSLVPPKVWGKRLLEQELRGHNFDPSQVPEACLQELADQTLELTRSYDQMASYFPDALGKKNSLSDRIAAIENLADEVVGWLGSPDSEPSERAQLKHLKEQHNNYVRDILARHGLLP